MASDLGDVVVLSGAPPANLTLEPASDTGNPGDLYTADSTPDISGSATPGTIIVLFADGTAEANAVGMASVDANGQWTVTSATLSEGNHSLSAVSVDGGITSDVSSGLTITIDTIAPDLPLDLALVGGGSVTTDSTPDITGSAEAGSVVVLYEGASVLGTATADAFFGTWTLTSSSLSDGAHSLTATAMDAAGNTSSVSSGITVTIDTAAVTPTGLDLAAASDSGRLSTDDITNDRTPTISGSAEANSVVTLYDGATLLGSATANPAGGWTITSTTLLDGVHTLTAVATDGIGNTSTASSGLVVTIDTQMPLPPGTPDLVAASDSGRFSVDDVTNDFTPTLTGSAEAGATVKSSPAYDCSIRHDCRWRRQRGDQACGICGFVAREPLDASPQRAGAGRRPAL